MVITVLENLKKKKKIAKIKQCKINMLHLRKMRISSLNRIKSPW